MNADDRSTTPENLRLATSRSLPAGSSLDADTAALRENFLALGNSCQAAADDLDEAALLQRLEQACLEPLQTSAIERTSSANLVRWIALIAGGVLAASVLIAMVLRNSPEPAANHVVKVSPTPIESKSPTAPPVGKTQPSDEPLVAWTDPLDEEIASAQAEVQWLTSRGAGVDSSLTQVSQQLEALSQELLGESL